MSTVKLLHVGTMEQALNAFTRALNADPSEQAWLVEIAEAAHEVLDRHTSPDTIVSEEVADNADDGDHVDVSDEEAEEHDFTCRYCGRESTARIGRIAHERACAKNPNAKQKSSRKASTKQSPKAKAVTQATPAKAKPKKQKKARKARISCACGRTMGENGFNGTHINWCAHAKAGDWEYAS